MQTVADETTPNATHLGEAVTHLQQLFDRLVEPRHRQEALRNQGGDVLDVATLKRLEIVGRVESLGELGEL